LQEAAPVALRLERGRALRELGDQIADEAAGRTKCGRGFDNRASIPGVAEC
jgi:hypothetical protein